jgi:hypothetical protein
MPLIAPAEDTVRPGEMFVADQVYGAVPPETANAEEYCAPIVAVGRLVVVITGGFEATGGGGLTATVALDCAPFAALVAVIVTFVLLDTAGAVNTPLLLMLPALADHVTAVLLVPCMAALNCRLVPEIRVALVGLTVTVIVGLAVEIAGALMTIWPCLRRTFPAESSTSNLKLLVPARVGVPVTNPVSGSKLKPLGSVPDISPKL